MTENQGIAIRVLGALRVRRGADYEDARAEAMLALVVAASTFEPGRGVRFSTWAWLKVSGAVKDWMERQRRARPRGLSRVSEAALELVADYGLEPDEAAYDREVEAVIGRCLEGEDPAVQELADGVVFGGLTTRQCAQRAGSTFSAACRARKQACKALALAREDLELDPAG